MEQTSIDILVLLSCHICAATEVWESAVSMMATMSSPPSSLPAPGFLPSLGSHCDSRVLSGWEPALTSSVGRSGPGALSTGFITNHPSAWLLLPPPPCSPPLGSSVCRSPGGKADPACILQAGGRGCSPCQGTKGMGGSSPCQAEGQDAVHLPSASLFRLQGATGYL